MRTMVLPRHMAAPSAGASIVAFADTGSFRLLVVGLRSRNVISRCAALAAVTCTAERLAAAWTSLPGRVQVFESHVRQQKRQPLRCTAFQDASCSGAPGSRQALATGQPAVQCTSATGTASCLLHYQCHANVSRCPPVLGLGDCCMSRHQSGCGMRPAQTRTSIKVTRELLLSRQGIEAQGGAARLICIVVDCVPLDLDALDWALLNVVRADRDELHNLSGLGAKAPVSFAGLRQDAFVAVISCAGALVHKA